MVHSDKHRKNPNQPHLESNNSISIVTFGYNLELKTLMWNFHQDHLTSHQVVYQVSRNNNHVDAFYKLINLHLDLYHFQHR
ncbi:unnamed protein product [Schistosoma mattheei]|uniref:Uncharacterized protein n=1 Tax=Schistosoma mattheei TaxID=31246 RepID=A0A183PPA9_9TREM|nr:unnamed protein product [Schistosoma mattheei]